MRNIKIQFIKAEPPWIFKAESWRLFRLFASYRTGMTIKDAVIFSDGYVYYCCPRCSVCLDREFVSYCDRCGQKLNWKQYRLAAIRHPEACRV